MEAATVCEMRRRRRAAATSRRRRELNGMPRRPAISFSLVSSQHVRGRGNEDQKEPCSHHISR